MSLHKCPRCGNEAATNSRVTALEVAPNLLCVHGDEAVKMELVTTQKVNDDAIVDS